MSPSEVPGDPDGAAGRLLRHVVLFGFAPTATQAQITEVVRRFVALRDLVPGIEGLEWGLNNSPEHLDHGLTHCFMLTFGSTEARDGYLGAPDHVAFTDVVGPLVEHVTVVDYWATVDAP